MTVVDLEESPAPPTAEAALTDPAVERALGLLSRAAAVRSWPSGELERWVAGQPDVERALGQLILRAARPGGAATLPAATAATAALAAPAAPSRSAPSPHRPEASPLGGALVVAGGRPAAVQPVTEPAGLAPSRRRVARASLWVRNLGAVVLLLLVYQWWGTGLEQHRAQARLRAQSARMAALPPSPGNPMPATVASAAPASLLLPGQAVVHLEIPTIGVDQFVVEGTGKEDLKQGPGHYTGSPMPGQPGNAAIAGHRTTYGAPFERLDDLKAGDTIVATTGAGRFSYAVSEKLTVTPSETGVLDDFGDNRLTLTTCTPKFSAQRRLVVVARLQGPVAAPVSPPPPATAPLSSLSPAAARLDRQPRGFDLAALPPALLAAAALVGLALLYGPLRRRWPPLATAIVLAPLWIGGLVMLFEQLDRFLPANV
jgi:sortase A